MLKNLTYLFISLLLISCSSEKKNETAERQTNHPILNSNVFMGYKLKRGDSNKFRLTTNTSQTQELITDTLLTSNSDQTEIYILDTEVISANKDSLNEIKVNISQIDMTGNMNGRRLEYHSGKANSKEIKSMFGEYEILLNSPFRVYFGPDGAIVKVSDIDKIINNLTKASGREVNLSDTEKKSLSNQVSESILTPVCQQVFRRIPNKMMEINSTWEIKQESALATFQVTNTATYTLKKINLVDGDTLIYISASLIGKARGQNTMKDENAAYFFHQPKITGHGEIIYNLSKGIFQSSDVSVKIDLLIDITTKDESGNSINVKRRDITHNNYKVELL